MKKHILWSNIENDDEYNVETLDIIRNELYIPVNDIVAIADVGRWNGRVVGYKEIGRYIADCLYSDCDYAEWYVDNFGHFKADMYHHDGVNHIVYMAWKDETTAEQMDIVLNNIYNAGSQLDSKTQRSIRRYMTNVGYDIARVFGWKLNRR